MHLFHNFTCKIKSQAEPEFDVNHMKLKLNSLWIFQKCVGYVTRAAFSVLFCTMDYSWEKIIAKLKHDIKRNENGFYSLSPLNNLNMNTLCVCYSFNFIVKSKTFAVYQNISVIK